MVYMVTYPSVLLYSSTPLNKDHITVFKARSKFSESVFVFILLLTFFSSSTLNNLSVIFSPLMDVLLLFEYEALQVLSGHDVSAFGQDRLELARGLNLLDPLMLCSIFRTLHLPGSSFS
ncbi:hypothetical protein PAMP_011620 [Pampus punctatissimus]